MGADDYYLFVRICGLDLLEYSNAIHARHPEVAENNFRLLVSKYLQASFSILCGQHLIASILQSNGQNFAYGLIIVNDEEFHISLLHGFRQYPSLAPLRPCSMSILFSLSFKELKKSRAEERVSCSMG